MQEFNLTAPTADLAQKFHLARLAVPKFNMNDAAPPLYMYRGDPSLKTAYESIKAEALAQHLAEEKKIDDEDTNMEIVGEDVKDTKPIDDPKKKRPFKKKTKVYYASQAWASSRAVRRRHYYPWLFEDSEGYVNFAGKLEGDQHANYVLFVYNDQGGFTVIPVDEWFKFQSRITYRTLTADEAEEQMKSKGVSMDRWMMHRQKDQQPAKTKQPLMVVKGETGQKSGKSASARMKGDYDEMLFEDSFEDDEEYGDDDRANERDEEAAERQTRQRLFGDEDSEDEREMEGKRQTKPETKVKEVGGDTSKLLKKMKQTFVELSGDENPYADSSSSDYSSSESVVSEKESPKAPSLNQSLTSIRLKIGGDKQGSRGSSRAVSPASSSTSVPKRKNREMSLGSREGSPTLSDASSSRPSKRVRKSTGGSSALITAEEIIQFIESKGGRISDVKELIAFFAKRIKNNDENRKLLPSLLKDVATKDGKNGFVIKK
jgi:transcription initiation factor TFIIF subunit alpha